MILEKLSWGLITATLLLSTAHAQSDRFSVGPANLNAGGTADISYANPSLAGQTILVEIDNGALFNTQYDYVTITLDASGQGSASWNVPESGWNRANFNAPDASEITRNVLRPRRIT